jgi:hypothetical protein
MITQEEFEHDLRTALERTASAAPLRRPEWLGEGYLSRRRTNPERRWVRRRLGVAIEIALVVAIVAVVLVAFAHHETERVPSSPSTVPTPSQNAFGPGTCGLGLACPAYPGVFDWTATHRGGSTLETVGITLPPGWQFDDVRANYATLSNTSDRNQRLVFVDKPDLLPASAQGYDANAAEAEQRLRSDKNLVVSGAVNVTIAGSQWRKLTVHSNSHENLITSNGQDDGPGTFMTFDVKPPEVATVWVTARPDGHVLLAVLVVQEATVPSKVVAAYEIVQTLTFSIGTGTGGLSSRTPTPSSTVISHG